MTQIEERISILPNQITPELRAAYEALEAAVRMAVAPEKDGWISWDDFNALENALEALDAAKRAAP